MKRLSLITVLALFSWALFTSTKGLHAQSEQGKQKFEQLAKELKLTPQQKVQLIPIIEAEAPKVEEIKANQSLSRMQKMEQLKAIHDETDPRLKSILSPEQYQKLQEIRGREVREAEKKKRQY